MLERFKVFLHIFFRLKFAELQFPFNSISLISAKSKKAYHKQTCYILIHIMIQRISSLYVIKYTRKMLGELFIMLVRVRFLKKITTLCFSSPFKRILRRSLSALQQIFFTGYKSLLSSLSKDFILAWTKSAGILSAHDTIFLQLNVTFSNLYKLGQVFIGLAIVLNSSKIH